MPIRRTLFPILAGALLLSACAYIVTPEDEATPTSTAAQSWSGLVTHVGPAANGDLHIDLALRNDTGEWSAMQAVANKPAVLASSGGQATNCDTVFVGTGGTSLAPGFQMRGYTGGTKTKPATQLLYVECQGATAAPGAKLSISYTYVTGDFNYYSPATPINGTLELSLDQVAADLKYPIAHPVDGLLEKPGDKIEAINKCSLTLTAVKHTDAGLEFSWHTTNPTEYPSYVHIGTPPVIGADGVIYGFYESPHLADTPITPAGQTADWTTQVAVPKDVSSLYMLLSVESKQQKLFVSHAVDLSGQ